MTDKPANIREALERELDGGLQGMRYDLNGYPTLALPKARLLEILRLYPDPLTASEVKVLTETALRLGRKEAGDEIAETLEALGDSIGEGNQRELLADLADIARDIGSSPLGATWDVRSGVPGHQEVSGAVRSPQEPCGHPTCPCTSEEAR